MSDLARTRTSAIDELALALATYERAIGSVHDRLSRQMADVSDEVGAAVAARRREVDSAQAALCDCQRDPEADCSGPARALAQAEQRLARALQAMRRTNQAAGELAPAMARLSRETGDATRDGLALLRAARGDVETYLSSEGGGSTGSAAAPASPSALSAIPGAVGFSNVPLAAIDTSDREIGLADFGKGYSPADLTWAFNALHEVVLPALAAGHDAEYFQARDAAEHREGTRSYADTFGGFFRDDAICLERRGDRFHVANGYHRIWIARQMGLKGLPARVVE